jgi:hypothetical protein
MQLSATHINRDHMRRPMRQQHIGKTAGAGPNIKRQLASDINHRKGIKSTCQFQPRPTNPRINHTGDFYVTIKGKHFGRLFDKHTIGDDLTGGNQITRPITR